MSDTKISLEKKPPESATDSTSATSRVEGATGQPYDGAEEQSSQSPASEPLGNPHSAGLTEVSNAEVPLHPHHPDSGDASSEEKSDYLSTGATEHEEKEKAPSLGRFNACFDGLSKIGPLALLLALLCMAWPIFWAPDNNLYCPAEIRSLTAFLHSVATGSWYAPTGLENGSWTAAQWPVFTWCAALLALSPSLVASGYLLPTTSFLCTFFAVLGVWCLASAAGFGYRAAFAAALILLCTPIFAPLPNFVGPATVSAGFFLFALAFFCRGWRHDASWFSLPTAFVFTALAGMSGGWLLFIVPLLGSFCFLIWQGTLRRAHRADAIFGYILMLAIIGCWLIIVSMDSGNKEYLSLLFDTSWRTDWTNSKWFLPAIAGILGTAPWILMIFGVSWGRVCSHAGRTLAASRHSNASALVWICLTLALPIAFFMPWFHPAAVTIACLACVLLGKAAVKLGSSGSRFFYLLASLCLILAGCVILCLSFKSTQALVLDMLPALPVPQLGEKLLTLTTLPFIGGIVLLGGLIALMFVKRFSGSGPLIYGICLVIILCQPSRLTLVGELAAMPGSPLVPFSAIQAQVDQALAPAPTQPDYQPPAPPANPEPESPVPASPPMEPIQPATPAIPQFKAPEAPTAPEPAEQERSPDSGEAAPDLPEQPVPSPGQEPKPEVSTEQPLQQAPEESSSTPAGLPAPAIPPEIPGDTPVSQEDPAIVPENTPPAQP